MFYSFMSLTSKKYSITINNVIYLHILNDVSETKYIHIAKYNKFCP